MSLIFTQTLYILYLMVNMVWSRFFLEMLFHVRIGLIVNFTLFGDLYINFGDRNFHFPLLQPGIGIRCSYNGKGGNNRSNDICYSGGLMISVPWIGICDERGDRCFLIGSRGVRVELNPIRLDFRKWVTLGINVLTLDIMGLITCDKVNNLFFTNGLSICIFVGGSWWI